MAHGGSRILPGLRALRRLTTGLCWAGLPLLISGCTQPLAVVEEHGWPSGSSHLVAVDAEAVPRIARATEPETGADVPSSTATSQPRKPLPISLDTVLRLAEEQNSQIALARERVRDACAEKDVAAKSWLPNLYVGPAYYRHEGGIQNPDGTFVHSSTGALFDGMEVGGKFDPRDLAFQKIKAERKLWEQKGDLSKVTSETLLQAANTYIDLLVARTGESVARELEKTQQKLLDRSRKLAEQEPAARMQLRFVQAAMSGHQQTIAKLHQQGDAASIQLAYLLGLDSCVTLVPIDPRLVPIDLVDASLPTCDLVNLALTSGPGVRELEGLLGMIQEGLDRARGAASYFPALELRMAEGGFGAGQGAGLTWDNRWDLALQARWNLTELVTARERRRVAQSKLQQVHMTYQDLRAKLTAGVQEAREAILSGQEQIRLGTDQVKFAGEALDLSNQRFEESVPGSSATEVLQTMRSVESAQFGYLNAISAYDKAHLRLLVLLGPAAACGSSKVPPAVESSNSPSQLPKANTN